MPGRTVEARAHEFQPAEEDMVLEGQGRAWRRSGASLYGPAEEVLPHVPLYDVMWFAWYAFYPHTEVAG